MMYIKPQVKSTIKTVSLRELIQEMKNCVPSDFQRNKQWKDNDYNLCLDSIFNGLKIGTLHLWNDENTISMSDGQHRLFTIMAYIRNEIPYKMTDDVENKVLYVYFGSDIKEEQEKLELEKGYKKSQSVKFLDNNQRELFLDFVVNIESTYTTDYGIITEIYTRMNVAGKKMNTIDTLLSKYGRSEYMSTIKSIINADIENINIDMKTVINMASIFGIKTDKYDEYSVGKVIRSSPKVNSGDIIHTYFKCLVFRDLYSKIKSTELNDSTIYSIGKQTTLVHDKIKELSTKTAENAVQDFKFFVDVLEKMTTISPLKNRSVFNFYNEDESEPSTTNKLLTTVLFGIVSNNMDNITVNFNKYWENNYADMSKKSHGIFPKNATDSATNIYNSIKFVDQYFDATLNNIILTKK